MGGKNIPGWLISLSPQNIIVNSNENLNNEESGFNSCPLATHCDLFILKTGHASQVPNRRGYPAPS